MSSSSLLKANVDDEMLLFKIPVNPGLRNFRKDGVCRIGSLRYTQKETDTRQAGSEAGSSYQRC